MLAIVMAMAAFGAFPWPDASGEVRNELRRELQAGGAPAEILDFYASRDFAPIWVSTAGRLPFGEPPTLKPDAEQMLAMTQASELARPRAVQLRRLVAAAAGGEPAALARAEVGLSTALVAHVQRTGAPAAARPAFVDPELSPPSEGGVLEQAAAARSLKAHLSRLAEVNPVYSALQQAAARYRREWGRLPAIDIPAGGTLARGDQGERVRRLRTRLGLPPAEAGYDGPLVEAVARFQRAHGLPATGRADPATLQALDRDPDEIERQLAVNLVRARTLPATSSPRFVLVNVAAGELSYFERGRQVGTMRVAVGSRREPTPTMAGLIRYLVANPYWNVPVDMVRDGVAPKVLASGPAYFQAARLEALSDWSDAAEHLDPAALDWPAIAAGTQELRVRQRPGGDNMMGTVKFMLPNELGIYLHDTPHKEVFAAPQRLISAGCIRLERSSELGRWLMGGAWREPARLGMDQRLDLPQPTPVYIAYLTAAPSPHGLVFHPDVYGRDASLTAAAAS